MKCYYCKQHEAEYRFMINYMGNIGDIRLCGNCFQTLNQLVTPLLTELRERLQGHLSLSEELKSMLNSGEEENPKHVTHEEFLRWIGELDDFAEENAPTEPEEDLLPPDEENEFKKRRRLNELREKMSLAITAEDYETAACLRDEIGGLEKDGVGIGASQ